MLCQAHIKMGDKCGVLTETIVISFTALLLNLTLQAMHAVLTNLIKIFISENQFDWWQGGKDHR
jgi:hypothetical protein